MAISISLSGDMLSTRSKVEIDVPERCLTFVREKKSWGAAQKHCHNQNSDLVVVPDTQVPALADFIKREKEKFKSESTENITYVVDHTGMYKVYEHLYKLLVLVLV